MLTRDTRAEEETPLHENSIGLHWELQGSVLIGMPSLKGPPKDKACLSMVEMAPAWMPPLVFH